MKTEATLEPNTIHSLEYVRNTIEVKSIDETINKVIELGGSVTVPKMPIPGIGWLAYFKDTEGNVFGIMQSKSGVK